MFITRLLFKPLVRIIFTVGFVLLLSRPGWPTTLELRTGQVVTGTVISKDEDSYKIDTGIGFPVTYFIDEIKAIDGEPVSPPAPDVQEDEALPEPAEIKSEDTDISPQPQQPAGDELENVIEAEPAPTPMSPENTETETEAAGIAPDEEIQDTVQLEDFVIEETEPAEKARPMAQVIADEINQMMIKNNTATVQDEPVLRNGPATNLLEEPVKDVSEIESGTPQKEHPSPFGPTIKPREAQEAASDLATGRREEHQLIAKIMEAGPEAGRAAALSSVTDGRNSNAIFRALDNYVHMQKLRLHFAKTNFQNKLLYIKERLYQFPLHVRKDVLVVILCTFTVMYIVVCYPLMNIARKLGKKHSWLVWIPFVQLIYFIYIAGKPLWWTVFWAVPGVNYFMLLLLFVDILKAMKKSFWLIVLIIIPGVNILALWYLAIPRELKLKNP
ncbi:MAG: hypothetical protein A3C36_04595 [Omnitrophica WOR_2 bacterium RIFCSPHIGHO2_02_FULL_52_10]|nr:MAG: hypothetical protein A3C36_04595 [Omnitrophica WOR_2 bacterium RIFCSPHIGHO2_02_FULL_52_10]